MHLSRINFVPTNPGTDTVPKYRSIVQPDGMIQLVPDGVHYLQDEIQSYADQCDINNIMRRYQAGDVNALSSVQGTFADLFEMPQTRQEALQRVIDAEQLFADLPLEVRQQYGNSWQQFYLAGPDAIAAAYGLRSDPVSVPADPVNAVDK